MSDRIEYYRQLTKYNKCSKNKSRFIKQHNKLHDTQHNKLILEQIYNIVNNETKSVDLRFREIGMLLKKPGD